jgi:hypothetical protein
LDNDAINGLEKEVEFEEANEYASIVLSLITIGFSLILAPISRVAKFPLLNPWAPNKLALEEVALWKKVKICNPWNIFIQLQP